ncbi:Enhanced ethylene response protein 5 [Vitis vinifera]|uniref:Enhanced ethylene response protein 5 n=1 Tax=Vitis vinifera TaxID=29760 RepID=A0A438E8C0_VITVI|nr:Enhanced ethylene response protein 5 [Vitis vinifera]
MAYLSMGEAHRRITEYLNRFSDAVLTQDGSSLKQLLSISSNSPLLLSLADALNLFHDSNRLLKQSDRFSQISEIVSPLFALSRISDSATCSIPTTRSKKPPMLSFRSFGIGSRRGRWRLLYVIAYEIRVLAERADRELASVGKTPEKLKELGKGPKRVGALYVTCQLFKIYFKLGTVHLCRSVIRSIETARIFDFEEFPIRDKVTYMYYTGRLEVFNENFPAVSNSTS